MGPRTFWLASPIRLACVRSFARFGCVEACCERCDVADWTMPVPDLDVTSFGFGCSNRVLWGRIGSQRRKSTVMSNLEIKGATAAVVTSVVILVATFTAGGIYRNRLARETQPGDKPLAAESIVANGRKSFPSELCSLPWPGCGWGRRCPQPS